MQARIYQKAKSAMQSGRRASSSAQGGGGDWVLEFPRGEASSPNSLMGWASSGDTLRTVQLRFGSAEEAVAYAESCGIEYRVIRPHGVGRRGVRRSYADNFGYSRRESWTH